MNRVRPFRFLAIALLAAAAASARPSANSPASESVDPTILTLYAWDFQPADDRIITSPTASGSYLRYVVSSTAPFPGGYLEAGVQLPDGAEIVGIEIAYCDSSALNDMSATLYYTPDPGGASVAIAASTSYGRGCKFNGGLASHTVDNLNNSYAVEVSLPVGDREVALRAVRITYLERKGANSERKLR